MLLVATAAVADGQDIYRMPHVGLNMVPALAPGTRAISATWCRHWLRRVTVHASIAPGARAIKAVFQGLHAMDAPSDSG